MSKAHACFLDYPPEMPKPGVTTEMAGKSNAKESSFNGVMNSSVVDPYSRKTMEGVNTPVEKGERDSFTGVDFDSPGGAPMDNVVEIRLNFVSELGWSEDWGPDSDIVSKLRETDITGGRWDVVDKDVE